MFSRYLALPLLALVLLGGCSRPNTNTPNPSNAYVTKLPDDDLGRPVALKAPAQRVVIIGPGAIETMYVLGASKQLVGRDDYANYPPEVRKVAVGGDYKGPNVEQCLAIQPDLVIVQGETWNKSRVEDWQSKIGKPVAALTTTNFKTLATDIRKLGAWIGKTKEAEALAAKFDIPTPKAKGTALVQTGDAGGWIAGRGTLVADTVAHAGYKNIADVLGIDGYQQINLESLLVHPPDVLVVPSSKSKEQVLTSLRSVPALAKLPCLQKGRVLVVDGDFLLRPGPRLLQGVSQLKKQSDELNRR